MWGAISVSLTNYNLLTSEFWKKSPILRYLEICILHKKQQTFQAWKSQDDRDLSNCCLMIELDFLLLIGLKFSFCVEFQCQFWTQRLLRKVTGDMVVCFLTKPPHLTSRPGNAILVRLNWQFRVFSHHLFLRQWDHYGPFKLGTCGKDL